MEASTNLIGGQPISYENMKAVTDLAKEHGIPTVLDASLLQDNLYFIKVREESMKDKSIREITRMIADLFDIIYFSGRKFGFGRGDGILVRDEAVFHAMEDYVTMFEGFLTYGGMSVKEMEAMIVGFEETMDFDVISQGPAAYQPLREGAGRLRRSHGYTRRRTGWRTSTPARWWITSPLSSIRPDRWWRRFICAAASAAWNAAHFLRSATRMARSASPRWKWCVWLSRAAYSPCLRRNT